MQQHRDALRVVARNILAQQDRQNSSDPAQLMSSMPETDAAKAAAEASLASLPPADAQQVVNQSSAAPASGIGINFNQQPNPNVAQTQALPVSQPQEQMGPPQPPQATTPGVMLDPIANAAAQQMYETQRLDQATGMVNGDIDADRARSSALAEASAGQHEKERAQLNAATDERLKGMKEAAAVEAQVNDAKAPFVAQQIQIQQDKLQATKDLDDWHQVQLQSTMDRQNQFRDQMMQLANEHPEDIWGNASIGGKISGLIGIVAAGFAGQDASARVQATVQEAVNVQMRKARFLEEANNQQENIARTAEEMFGSKANAISALTAINLDIVSRQMDQAAARFANPLAQAKLHQAAALVKQEAAKQNALLTDQVMTDQYKSLDANVKLDAIRAQELHSQRAAAGTGLRQLEGMVPGRTGYLTPEEKSKFAPILGGGHALLDGLDRIRQLSNQIQEARKAGLTLENSGHAADLYAEYTSKKEALLKDWREYTHSGARIEDAEKQNFEALIPSFTKAATYGQVVGIDAGMNEARDAIVSSLQHTGDAYGIGTSAFDTKFPLYAESLTRLEARKKEGGVTKPVSDKFANEKDLADARKNKPASQPAPIARSYSDYSPGKQLIDD